MAHHIYTTDAFVLESTLSGEADRFYTLFTYDLGLVRATARGVRLQKSKLRYSLQDFSRTRVSLVRGKEVWRITSAKIEDNLFTRFNQDKNVIGVIAQIMALIRRLVGGEEKNETLFIILAEAFKFLEKREQWGSELKHFEIIVVLRVLHNLGYLRDVVHFKQFLGTAWTDELLVMLTEHKTMALQEINTSLRETQL
jgi:DNA repair protein RecO